MFVLYADKNQLCTRKREPVTSGSVNVYEVQFEFSPDWDGLTKTAIFKAGSVSRSVLLEEDGVCTIPWEVMAKPNMTLMAGVYGERGGQIVLPTTWSRLFAVQIGAYPGEPAQPPTPDLWEQELARKGDNLTYDGLNLALKSGEKTLSSVEITGGGGGIAYRFGHGLKQDGIDVSVDAVNDFTGDNTLPMTAAGVLASVGNIEALLATI